MWCFICSGLQHERTYSQRACVYVWVDSMTVLQSTATGKPERRFWSTWKVPLRTFLKNLHLSPVPLAVLHRSVCFRSSPVPWMTSSYWLIKFVTLFSIHYWKHGIYYSRHGYLNSCNGRSSLPGLQPLKGVHLLMKIVACGWRDSASVERHRLYPLISFSFSFLNTWVTGVDYSDSCHLESNLTSIQWVVWNRSYQVYRATLKNGDSDTPLEVAVKVRYYTQHELKWVWAVIVSKLLKKSMKWSESGQWWEQFTDNYLDIAPTQHGMNWA